MKNNPFTLAPHLPFAKTLAEWMLKRYGSTPLQLARAVVLVPNRRSCLTLREAFLRATDGRSLMLPRIRPLGDVPGEEILLAGIVSSLNVSEAASEHVSLPVQPVPALKRIFMLQTLVRAYHKARSMQVTSEYDYRMAGALAELFDECTREEVEHRAWKTLVPQEHEAHWQHTLKFLEIITQHWPVLAAQEEMVSLEEYRIRALKILAAHWRHTPPDVPVIIAGSTGSIPAVTELMRVVKTLPEGIIIVPGLDTTSAEEDLESTEEGHAQWGMRQLLHRLGVTRNAVQSLVDHIPSPRTQFLWNIMTSGKGNAVWKRMTPADVAEATAGMHLITCTHAEQEALAIALLMREVLETPGKTAALVTRDRMLAQRVASQMRRWHVEVDDSAGIPLSQTPAGVFMQSVIDAVANDMASVPLLSMLKHPLARGDMPREVWLLAVRALEKTVLRGVRRAGGIAGLLTAVEQQQHSMTASVIALLQFLEKTLQPLLDIYTSSAGPVSLEILINAHLKVTQLLAPELLKGPEARALGAHLEMVLQSCAVAPLLRAQDYPALWNAVMRDGTYRPVFGTHPRLKILSPLEARGQSFDRMILGSMNEGSWPPDMAHDPWFSPLMRKQAGLPGHARALGMAAHDFIQHASAPELFITRALKTGTSPSVPARWLTTIELILHSTGQTLVRANVQDIAWQWEVGNIAKPALPAAGNPPASMRLVPLHVTDVDILQHNPYAFYAKRILKLAPLDPLDEVLSVRQFGLFMHAMLERITLETTAYESESAMQARMEARMQALLEPYLGNASVVAVWMPKIRRITRWCAQMLYTRQSTLRAVYSECRGNTEFAGHALSGRADRIEAWRDGSWVVIDYKTGKPAFTNKQADEGLYSQLPLLAYLGMHQGYRGIEMDATRCRMEYWSFASRDGGEVIPLNVDLADVLMRIEARVRHYADPATAYRYVVLPGNKYQDYAHLARVNEWKL